MYNAYYSLACVLILNKTPVYTFEQKGINKNTPQNGVFLKQS